QSVIFHVEQHPVFAWFEQCVTFNFFPSQSHELAYNLFNVITVYVMPLAVITTSYSLILCKIHRNANMKKHERTSENQAAIRCSSAGKIGKAKIRTLKMTLVIVSAFILCWTPYFFMSALWWFNRDAASRIDPKVQRGLFLFAVSNACIDPMVYGKSVVLF
ncbi:hypothetical protein LOTGIDRAFT_75206, partial [Lottia gigantea]